MAFALGHSCETQLVHVLTSALESGQQVDVIYLDLQKAFDKVPMQDYYLNLSHIRLEGNYCGLQWIENFLSNRRQCVCLRGSQSDMDKYII